VWWFFLAATRWALVLASRRLPVRRGMRAHKRTHKQRASKQKWRSAGRASLLAKLIKQKGASADTRAAPLAHTRGTNFFNNTEACVFLGLVNGLLGSAYSNTCKNTSATGLGAVQVEPPTAGADGSPAPVPLQPQKLPLPASYSDAAITALLQKEGGTYAFLWIAIRNL
jgi:hypothetical protein